MKSILKKSAVPVISAAFVVMGALLSGGRHYTLVSVLVAAVSCIGFALSFEKKSLTSRYAVLTAVMTALSVAGRFIFAPIPAFKPMTAIVILSGMYLSPECGFLTGAMTALISNMYFGHGAWTPFQMLAWGAIGLFAGILAEPMKKRRLILLICGAFSGAFYSIIMDTWTVIWYSGEFSAGLYKAAVISALPFTAAYAVSNVIFLLFAGKSFGRKLSRAVTLIER